MIRSKEQTRPIFWPLVCYTGLTFCLTFAIWGAGDARGAETVTTEILYSSVTENQYWPADQQDLYTWVEDKWLISSRFQLSPKGFLSVAWQQGTIEQHNEIYDDTDFSLDATGPVAGFGYSWNDHLDFSGELSLTNYQDSSSSSYYHFGRAGRTANGAFDETLVTGNINGRFSVDNRWLQLTYSRARDTDPLYDPVTDRAELSIRTWELSGLSLGWLTHPEWELGGSLFYEDYESGTPDQLNVNGEILFMPAALKQFNLSLGTGYYTEEKETLVNLTGSYRTSWRKFDAGLEALVEYSENERSFLYQGTISLRYFFNRYASCSLKGGYGQEVGDDQDSYSEIYGGLSISF